MQGSSFLTVKQVATALGIDERSVRDKLTIGTLKGTKRTVGNKDQWFVHQRDLDAELARRGMNPASQGRQAANGLGVPGQVQQQYHQQFIGPDQAPQTPPVVSSEFDCSPDSGWNSTDLQADEEEIIAEVTSAPDADKTTSGGKRPGWLNEEMRRELLTTAEIFMKPLVDRIEALTAADKEKDAVLKAKDQEIEEIRNQLKLLPDLEAQRARLLREIESERQAAEIQFAKAREQEEQARALAEENEALKLKAEESALNAATLKQLQEEMLKLKQPWWKKLFGQ
jgi:hypothetical protein